MSQYFKIKTSHVEFSQPFGTAVVDFDKLYFSNQKINDIKNVIGLQFDKRFFSIDIEDETEVTFEIYDKQTKRVAEFYECDLSGYIRKYKTLTNLPELKYSKKEKNIHLGDEKYIHHVEDVVLIIS